MLILKAIKLFIYVDELYILKYGKYNDFYNFKSVVPNQGENCTLGQRSPTGGLWTTGGREVQKLGDCCFKGHLTSRDILGRHDQAWGTLLTLMTETRDTAHHPTMHR